MPLMPIPHAYAAVAADATATDAADATAADAAGAYADTYAADAAHSTPMPPMPPMPANAVHDLPLLSKLDLRTCTCPRSRTRTSPCRR